jgi:drug/metabolite transporter (DMT)-like permease
MSGEPRAATPEARAKTPAGLQGSALRGLALMFVSTFLFSAMHASIRYLSDTIHPFEIAFFRSLFSLVVVMPLTCSPDVPHS